jgi:hypothetical protein
MKKLCVVILILFPFLGRADIAPTKMHVNMFKVNLIVKTKIVSHTDEYYSIKILDIYRDNEIGIKVGDFIRIKKDINVITSVDVVSVQTILDRLTGVAFLTKTEFGWRMSQFPIFYDDEVTLRFDTQMCKVKGSSESIKKQIREYFREFALDEEEHLIGKKTEKEVLKSSLGQLALTQYAQLYQFTIDKKIYEKIDCGTDIIEEPIESAVGL